jgi:hypothetical protein
MRRRQPLLGPERRDESEPGDARADVRDHVEQAAAPDVSRVLTLDPAAFGLAVELLEPWAKAATSLAVLNRTLDEKTVTTAVELVERIMRLAPDTENESGRSSTSFARTRASPSASSSAPTVPSASRRSSNATRTEIAVPSGGEHPVAVVLERPEFTSRQSWCT